MCRAGAFSWLALGRSGSPLVFCYQSGSDLFSRHINALISICEMHRIIFASKNLNLHMKTTGPIKTTYCSIYIIS